MSQKNSLINLKKLAIFFWLVLSSSHGFSQGKEVRVALVIGNSAYKNSPLRNPVNDSNDMASLLRRFGFDVVQRNNITTKQIGNTLREFRTRLSPGSVALVFYAGHGVSIKGKNFFPAVDAEINGEEDVPNQSLSSEQIMDILAEAKTSLNLVFFDACRDNPYTRSFRTIARGLSRENVPSGTLISFATKPGSVALDGHGKNGLYTSVLLDQMKNSNQPIEQVLKKVATGVRLASNKQQETWMEGSIEGDFCFSTCGTNSASTNESLATKKEISFWEETKLIGSRAALQLYIKKYPNGTYVDLANLMLQNLDKAEKNQTNNPLYSEVGWTQESTESSEIGPWLNYSPKGTRFCRNHDGIIQRLYPPGVMPKARKANPFCLGDSTSSPQ